MRIIIPSAKIVSVDLQNLGKLPAVIYPVNQRIVYDYLYEIYKSSSFKVVVYENADKVIRRLAKYPNTVIKTLKKLGDLGYTVYEGIGEDTGEAIVNFGDTIVQDKPDGINEDYFFYSEDEVTDTWTYFEEHSGIITDILDKKDIRQDEKGKLFAGVFKFSHIEYFADCLQSALAKSFQELGMSSFYYALMNYSQKYPMKPIKANNWFDIGHADRYYNSQLEVKAREFNHIKIDKDRGILTKYSDDVDKFIGEIKWYLKLPGDIEYVRPRIFRYSTSYTKPYVSMEYYAYHTVHELFLYGDLNKNQWIDIFKRIRFVCNDFKRYTVKDDNILPALQDMYLNKTLQRFDRMKKDERFISFFESSIFINGRKYKSLMEISNILKVEIPKYLYDVDHFTIIHGDLCFANIMIDNNYSFIKVIDPRGKFGSYDIYGDPRYELAKLFHSVDGKYDFIIKDQFDINYDLEQATINYSINDRQLDFDLFTLFKEVFAENIGNDLKKIELIEALLFLSMIPLHGENIKHQLTMLGTGLDILNRVVDITD